jgi:hypothetical protein
MTPFRYYPLTTSARVQEGMKKRERYITLKSILKGMV